MNDRVKPLAPPTQARLKELFDYNPETGDFVRRVSVISSNGRAGCIAGSTDTTGYRQIRVNGWLYRAHVLAWVYMTGEYPKDMIDHIDMNRANNAFKNLRECSTNQNQYNTAARQANKLGIKNVHQSPDGKYVGTVKKNDRQHRKMFLKLSDAIDWVQAKRFELHGEFAYVDQSAPVAKEGE